MSIAKVVEVNSSSNKSFEDAIQSGIAKVTETVKNVQGAWINEQKVVIKDNKITEYQNRISERYVNIIRRISKETGELTQSESIINKTNEKNMSNILFITKLIFFFDIIS